jgi:hypothetical protein
VVSRWGVAQALARIETPNEFVFSMRQLQKVFQQLLGQKVASVSPLKQRTEEVLRSDRRAIRDPFAHLLSNFLLDQ